MAKDKGSQPVAPAHDGVISIIGAGMRVVGNCITEGTLRVEGVLEGEETDAPGEPADGRDGESDPLYDQAVEMVLRTRRASISLVQRHLRIGYNRAARLIEQMEQAGLVSAMQTNGNREVLVPAKME